MTSCSVTKVDKLGASAAFQPVSMTYRSYLTILLRRLETPHFHYRILPLPCTLFKPQSFNRIYILHPLLRPLPASSLPSSLCRSAVPPTDIPLPYLALRPLQTSSEELHVRRGAPDLSMENPQEADPEDLLHEIMRPCIPDNPSMMQGPFPSIHLRLLLRIRVGTTTCPFCRSTQNLTT
jgi:hypothetical protein